MHSLSAAIAIAFLAYLPAGAQSEPAPPVPYDAFIKGATVQAGLLPVIKKNGAVYLYISQKQLDKDFIQTAVPQTGLGGFGPAPGEPYVAPARILRFGRSDDKVILRYPNTYAAVVPNSPYATSTAESLPASVLAVLPVVAQDALGGVVIPASSFLGDVADYNAIFTQLETPGHSYHLDPSRSFFVAAKALPENDVLRVSQTWASSDPQVVDNAPDPRSIEVAMTYNIIAAPQDGYVPRFSDPRVGYFEQPLLDFTRDRTDRSIYYISRWNFKPETPGRPSNAKNPLTFYLSNDVPLDYRSPIRSALLKWNDAFARIGILNAVKVEQQPTDPAWDADDIRHNVVRWISTSSPQYGAEALLITDPRSGEELNSAINIDAVEGLARRTYRYIIAPARGLADTDAAERAYAADAIYSVTLHESGHDLGLQHNFIGSMAYTAKQLQSRQFTSRMGTGSSVMEYNPVNVWPKGTPQGTYNQDVLGPYDYYAVKYGYQYIPNATTPSQELPTLRRWGSRWADPMYRFASDEDVSFTGGHAIDPRVQQFDLTDHPLAWCETQMTMLHGLMDRVNARFPASGQSYEEARNAFTAPLRQYLRCAIMPAHAIGGEYLSRAYAGDPRSAPPLQPVSRAANAQAWQLLSKGLFSDAAFRFNPNVLNRMVYREVSAFSNAQWAYNPAARHDIAIAQIAAGAQDQALNEIFAPLTLQRIDDLPYKYARGSTISLTDLFDWTRAAIFGGLSNGRFAGDGQVRRNLQMRYARRLALMWTSPPRGMPTDAQSLARLQLEYLKNDATVVAARRGLDEQSRAHAAALLALARQALEARATIAPPPPVTGP